MLGEKDVLLLLPVVLAGILAAIALVQTRIAPKIQEMDARLLLLTEKLLEQDLSTDKGLTYVVGQLLILPDFLISTCAADRCDEIGKLLRVIKEIQLKKRKYELRYRWSFYILMAMFIVFSGVAAKQIFNW